MTTIVIPSAARNLQFLLLACAMPLTAQTRDAKSDTAKATAILARHTEAVGGLAALRAIKEFHMMITVAVPSAPGAPVVKTDSYVKAPNRIYMKTDMPGLGAMEIGFDGKTAWSSSPMTGPTIHDEVPRQLLDAVNFSQPPLEGLKAAYLGRRQIGTRSYDAVRVVYPDSQIATNYFDLETGLWAGLDNEGAPAPPAGRMTMSFDEYKRFGKTLYATKVTTVMPDGQEMVMRSLMVSQGPIDDKIFELPPAVRELRDKQAKGGKP